MGVRWVTTVKATASIAPVLPMFFNRSIQTGKQPSAWKVSNIIPIPKGSSSDEPHNYRPIVINPSACVGSKQARTQFMFGLMANTYTEQHGTTHTLGSDMTGKE